MPYRIVGDEGGASVQLLLVTTRTTGRWIIPKGNVDYNMSPYRAAEQEAEEEAGVKGDIARQPIGVFRYRKRLCSGITATAKVVVFPLRVTEELDDWQERSVRLRKWFSADEAADAVVEADLAALFKDFVANCRKRPTGTP